MQSHGQIASRQAGIIDNPGLSYGFFHVAGKPNKLWGVVTTGFTVNGIMADIGHLRHLRWVQDDDPASPINQPPAGSTSKAGEIPKQRWISYNRMRGQYASAMEHATPEQFFVDKTQCGAANQPVCQQAISAVKALQIAAQEGQKIYTITQANLNSALPKITAGKYVFEEIQNAVAAGKEVTIHERPIHAFGWSGSGYAVVDPETGAGAYMIEGGANGGFLLGVLNGIGLGALLAGFVFGSPVWLMLTLAIVLVASIVATLIALANSAAGSAEIACYFGGINAGMLLAATVVSIGALAGLKLKAEAVEKAIQVALGEFFYGVFGPSDSKIWDCPLW